MNINIFWKQLIKRQIHLVCVCERAILKIKIICQNCLYFRLRVAANEVSEVYRTAKLLRMGQAAQACSAFLAGRLTPSNCLGISPCSCVTHDLWLPMTILLLQPTDRHIEVDSSMWFDPVSSVKG